MGILGKVFLIINFLVATAIVYFASQDWAKRQELTALAARQQLFLEGLPLEPGSDENEVAVELSMPGGELIPTMEFKFLVDHFKGSDGGTLGSNDVPHSILDEVRRATKKIEGNFRAGGDDGKVRFLCGTVSDEDPATKTTRFLPGLLYRLAESYEEREAIRRIAYSKQPDLEKVETLWKKRLDAVLNAPNPKMAADDAAKLKEASDDLRTTAEEAQRKHAVLLKAIDDFRKRPKDVDPNKQEEIDNDEAVKPARKAYDIAKAALDKSSARFRLVSLSGGGACRDSADRRRRAAHLLIHLDDGLKSDDSAKWQKRVAVVVGLKTYRQVIGEQVNRIRSMLTSTQQQIAYDQLKFSDEYEILKMIAYERSMNLEQLQELSTQEKVQRTRDEEAVIQRGRQLASRQNTLASLRSEVAKAIEEQTRIEQRIFNLERKVGEALQGNLEKYERIVTTEEKIKSSKGQ